MLREASEFSYFDGLDYVPLPNSYVEALTSNVMIFGDGAFRR